MVDCNIFRVTVDEWPDQLGWLAQIEKCQIILRSRNSGSIKKISQVANLVNENRTH